MNLLNFVNLYKNRYIDFEGVFPNQCMDLAHFWAYVGLGIFDKSFLSRDYAKNVWWNYNPAWNYYVDKITNQPANYPAPGDWVIWDGGTGHIAVCIGREVDPTIPDPTIQEFWSFDANWPSPSLPHFQRHNYTLVLGWLRPKPGVTDMQRLEILWREAELHGWNLNP
jgi:hypothetical protein